jgi:hypothetical protein
MRTYLINGCFTFESSSSQLMSGQVTLQEGLVMDFATLQMVEANTLATAQEQATDYNEVPPKAFRITSFQAFEVPGAADPSQAPTMPAELNAADVLPPEECPILIELPGGSLICAERTRHIEKRSDAMEYRIAGSEVLITGRLRWAYP